MKDGKFTKKGQILKLWGFIDWQVHFVPDWLISEKGFLNSDDG